MPDILDKVVAFCLFIILAVFVPIMLLGMKTDMSVQGYMEAVVTEFVDKSRVTGMIHPDAYEELAMSIDSVQGGCEIRMYVTRQSTAYDEEIHKKEILMEMYPDHADAVPFMLNKGDILSVSVNTTKPSFGNQLYSLIIGGNTHMTYTTYSGMVGNVAE
ncbi:MAG: hypothetical protein E7265_10680 [Lachnospiraceae bacterium]|nr:hypothetical protein [Lachnospiraceae bacterium]